MNKRGVAELIDWVWPLVMMIIAVVIIGMLVRYYSARHVEAQDLDAQVYAARILGGDVIMYTDPQTGRTYPGVIDPQKFTSAHLDDIFTEHGKKTVSQIASRIVLTGGDACGPSEKTIYNDKATFDEKLPQNKLQGAGGASLYTESRAVVIHDGDKRCNAQLTLTIVRPNS